MSDNGGQRVTGAVGRIAGAALAVALAVPILAACTPDAPAEGDAGAGESRAQALATLTAVSADAGSAAAAPGDLAQAPPPDVAGPTADEGMLESIRATQAIADATAGIADVNALVDSMPVLATFTPAPRPARPDGAVVYLRGGAFQRADAGGDGTETLDLDDDMPAVWSPPDDPGRAWASEDGRRVAMYVGTDAEMWTMDADGDDNRRVSGPNLPTDEHVVTVGDAEQTVRLRPGTDYTLVAVPGGTEPLSVLVDDNSRHIRGEARLRIVHAADIHRDRTLVALVGDVPVGRPMAFGQASGDDRVYAGQLSIELRDEDNNQLAWLPAFPAGDRELKTVFLHGSDELLAYETSYEPGTPPSGNARVRLFNATGAPIDAVLEDGTVLAQDLEPGALGPYATVAAVLGVDEREDARITLYGLRGEQPVAWSPDGDRLAFVGIGDGQVDLYVGTGDGAATRLTRDDAQDRNPVWSPAGRRLVWESVDEGFDIHELRLWSGSGSPRTVDMTPVREAMGWPDTANIQFPGGFGWVDEETLYFYPKSDRGAGGLWLADGATGAPRQLFAGSVTEPDFSQDAAAWAFVPADRPGEIVVLTADGRESTIARGQAHHPLWSPDGRQISWVEGESTSGEGWRLHVVNADGTNDRVLTDWWPLLQTDPPVPGPKAKRWWLDDGRRIAFTRAGRDYGAAERSGPFGAGQAGDDIENLWIVAVDGESAPVQATDLTRVFYLGQLQESPDRSALALVGFSYRDRSQQLWTLPAAGGKPTKIDGGVRWYYWER